MDSPTGRAMDFYKIIILNLPSQFPVSFPLYDNQNPYSKVSLSSYKEGHDYHIKTVTGFGNLKLVIVDIEMQLHRINKHTLPSIPYMKAG